MGDLKIVSEMSVCQGDAQEGTTSVYSTSHRFIAHRRDHRKPGSARDLEVKV